MKAQLVVIKDQIKTNIQDIYILNIINSSNSIIQFD